MQFMLLIYGPPGPQTQQEIDAEMGEYWAYEKAVTEAGVKVASEALYDVSAATTVRVRGGQRSVTDGPFAETREILGGYYVLDVPDLDAALDWAARCPGATRGSIEVRPIMVFEEPEG